jgi:hypothetical protein
MLNEKEKIRYELEKKIVASNNRPSLELLRKKIMNKLSVRKLLTCPVNNLSYFFFDECH